MIRLSEMFGVSLDELVLGKTQNRQEIPQHSAQPVENAKAKRRKRMRLCLLAGVLCLVLAVALLPLHQMFDQHLWGNWYTSVWTYLPTVPHNVLLLQNLGLDAAVGKIARQIFQLLEQITLHSVNRPVPDFDVKLRIIRSLTMGGNYNGIS